MNQEIPFYSFTYQHEQVKEKVQLALQEVFDSAWYVLGERVEHFEQQYADYLGVKHCIGVGNGLDALKMSLHALGIGAGDEVIVPANTYIATVLAVTAVGATPVLVEPDSHTFNICPEKTEEKITSKTKAIIPVHLYGLPCEMDAIAALALRYQLVVVEDNAQAAGAEYKGRKTGSLGLLNAHSFYPTKNLGALGDGGAITTNDDHLAKKVRLLRNYGSSMKYHHELQGYNSRLDEIQAAVLSVKLDYLDQWIKEKAALVRQYNERLHTVKNIVLPLTVNPEFVHAQHLYVIQSPDRDALAEYLKKQQIHTLIHYPVPVYRQAAYKAQFDQQAYPDTDKLSSHILSLPLFPGMTTEQVERVAFHIRQFYGVK